MHREWTDQFSAYLDGELAQDARRRVEAHVASCPGCRAVLGDLEAVVGWARHQAGAMPERDLWPGIRDRIEAGRVVPLVRRLSWRQLVAAGLLLAAGGAGAVWYVATGGAPSVGEVASVERTPVARALVAGNADYDAAVRDLEGVLARGRTTLDSSTVRVLEESLRTIDRAIADAREAIQRDPGDAYLNGRIAAHMRQKLAILRMATRAIAAES